MKKVKRGCQALFAPEGEVTGFDKQTANIRDLNGSYKCSWAEMWVIELVV